MQRPWEAIVAYQDSYDRSTDPADREPALFGIITAYADVNQAAVARAECNQYLKEFPQGTNAFTVGYLLGATALQENDPKAAETYFGRMLAEQPASTLREEMRFLLANAQFAQGKYDEARRPSTTHYQQDFPQGAHFEEAVYRIALGEPVRRQLRGRAQGPVEDYLRQYPSGDFVSDAKYRLGVCKYAREQVRRGDRRHARPGSRSTPATRSRARSQALLGDAYAATGKTDEALAAYQTSFKTATTDEVLNYSLMEAGKILQKKRRLGRRTPRCSRTSSRRTPTIPTVVSALSQIGRAKAKQGKVDEAKHFLADTLEEVHRRLPPGFGRANPRSAGAAVRAQKTGGCRRAADARHRRSVGSPAVAAAPVADVGTPA